MTRSTDPPGTPPEPSFPPAPCVDIADLMLRPETEPDWLVKDLFVRATVNVLWAMAGMGKSYFALQLAAALSEGKPFLEFEISAPGTTLFFSLEGGERDLTVRVKKHTWEHPPTVKAIFALALKNEADFETLTRWIFETKAALVIIDPITLISLRPGWDWNDNSIVGAFMARLDKIAVETGACILLIHHKKKGPKDDTPNEEYDRTTATGAQALVNLCSTRIHIRGLGHGERILYIFGKNVQLMDIPVRHGEKGKSDVMWRRHRKYDRKEPLDDAVLAAAMASNNDDLRTRMGLLRCGECGVWSSNPEHSRHVIGSLRGRP